MPGNLRSMAKILLPSSLSAVSSRFSDIAVTQRALAGGVGDHALGHFEFNDRHVPLIGRRLHQHDARGSAAPADIILRGADATAAASAHFTPGALGREI